MYDDDDDDYFEDFDGILDMIRGDTNDIDAIDLGQFLIYLDEGSISFVIVHDIFWRYVCSIVTGRYNLMTGVSVHTLDGSNPEHHNDVSCFITPAEIQVFDDDNLHILFLVEGCGMMQGTVLHEYDDHFIVGDNNYSMQVYKHYRHCLFDKSIFDQIVINRIIAAQYKRK